MIISDPCKVINAACSFGHVCDVVPHWCPRSAKNLDLFYSLKSASGNLKSSGGVVIPPFSPIFGTKAIIAGSKND